MSRMLVSSYWLGVIRLLVALGEQRVAMATVLALGDVKLLTQPQPWGESLSGVEGHVHNDKF